MNPRTCLIFSILFCILSSSDAKRVQLPYFNKELNRFVEVLESNTGKASVQTDNKAAIFCSAPDGFTGFIGLDLEAEQLTWRQYYHWWNLTCTFQGRSYRGSFKLKIRCFDEKGELLEEISLQEPSIKTGNFRERFVKNCIPVPKCRINDPSHPAKYFYLGFSFQNWRGQLDIHRLEIEKFTLTDNIKAPYLLTNNKARVGAMSWFEPSYCPIGTASEAMRDTAHKLFSAAGIQKMRFMAVWGDHFRKNASFRVEPCFEVEKGNYNFEQLDDYVDELDYYGNSIGVLTLWGTPTWSHSKTIDDIPEYKRKSSHSYHAVDNATFPPDDWEDYRRFVSTMVKRYKGKINDYEVWNEPDAWHYGMTFGYESYIDYLSNFYTAAKEVNPECDVYAGRISMWLVPCIREGNIQNFCDAIADHPYPGRSAGWKASVTRMDEMIKSMYSQNIQKPLTVTEVGLGAGYPWPGPGGYHGEQAKAQNAEILIDKLSAYTPEVYWYTPIQAGRAYGILHYTHNRYRPNPLYYVFAKQNERLNNEDAPVKAKVILPKDPVKKGKTTRITLTAQNTSKMQQRIRFWPVGLIDDLGYHTFREIRKYDKTLTLEPGASHTEHVGITVQKSASGKYPVGLAVINDQANSLALEELPIRSIAGTSHVKASSCDEGEPSAINSLFEPVWSGDIDVPRLIWQAKDTPRTEWVQLNFDTTYTVTETSVYWVANPKPQSFFPELKYDTHIPPKDWKVFYQKGDQWIAVENQSAYKTAANCYNHVSFKPVRTSAIQIRTQLEAGKNAGILQVKIK